MAEEDRPEWVKCIAGTIQAGPSPTLSMCGEHRGGWQFVSVSHALAAQQKHDRLIPCANCCDVAVREVEEMAAAVERVMHQHKSEVGDRG